LFGMPASMHVLCDITLRRLICTTAWMAFVVVSWLGCLSTKTLRTSALGYNKYLEAFHCEWAGLAAKPRPFTVDSELASGIKNNLKNLRNTIQRRKLLVESRGQGA